VKVYIISNYQTFSSGGGCMAPISGVKWRGRGEQIGVPELTPL